LNLRWHKRHGTAFDSWLTEQSFRPDRAGLFSAETVAAMAQKNFSGLFGVCARFHGYDRLAGVEHFFVMSCLVL
jgi:hypothetical protein